MKECKQIKINEIEVKIVELLKYICRNIVSIIFVSLIIMIIVPSLKYLFDRMNADSNDGTELYVWTETQKLKEYKEQLNIFNNRYLAEKEYKNQSLIMKLDSKNINIATLQFYVIAQEEMMLDVMTAYSNYADNGDLVADIYEMDKSVEAKYLKEIIKVNCSSYSNFDASAVINVKIYGENKEICSGYVDKVKNAFDNFSYLLNGVGIENEIKIFSETYHVGQDSNIRVLQENQNTLISKLESDIINLTTTIEMMQQNGIVSADEEEILKKEESFDMRYVILGAVVGIVISVIFLSIKYIFSGKIKYSEELAEYLNIPVFGEVNICKKSFGDKIFNKKFVDNWETQSKLISCKIASMCVEESISQVDIIGLLEADMISKTEELTLKLEQEGIKLKVTGDIVNDFNAIKLFDKGEKAVIIAVAPKNTSYKYVNNVIEFCNIKKVNILGYVFFS